jgi:hypothetical protein
MFATEINPLRNVTLSIKNCFTEVMSSIYVFSRHVGYLWNEAKPILILQIGIPTH